MFGWLTLIAMSKDDRGMTIVLLLCCLAMSLYIFLNPETVKKANQAERLKRYRLGSKPVWFFRLFGLAGTLIGLFLLYTVFRTPTR
jgi:hypothetical protein